MVRKILVLTALQCEAAPLIKAWRAKPMREAPWLERFQVFYSANYYIALTGIGKMRSAIATATLITALFAEYEEGESPPIIANIGIAGSGDLGLPIGTLTYINKVRDVASNIRFYPDILVRHALPERGLDTYDHPVTIPPGDKVLVDMEGAGMIQAATTLGSPSSVCILKIISDYCTGARVSPEQAGSLIAAKTGEIRDILTSIDTSLNEPRRVNSDGRNLLRLASRHGTLSLTQRTEIERRVKALEAQGIEWITPLTSFINQRIDSKEARNTAFSELLNQLSARGALTSDSEFP